MDSPNCIELQELAVKKINFGEDLLKSLENFKHIEGSQKLGRKIGQELKFLRKVSPLYI